MKADDLTVTVKLDESVTDVLKDCLNRMELMRPVVEAAVRYCEGNYGSEDVQLDQLFHAVARYQHEMRKLGRT